LRGASHNGPVQERVRRVRNGPKSVDQVVGKTCLDWVKRIEEPLLSVVVVVFPKG
jgi:hypothetical protein